MKFQDGTELTANEWFVFRQWIKSTNSDDGYGYTTYAVFPGETPTARAARRIVDQLQAKGLIESTGLGRKVSEKGWACWRERR